MSSQENNSNNNNSSKTKASSKEELKAAVSQLKSEQTLDFPKTAFNQTIVQRFFIVPSFEIYGGIAGLYDLGPPCTAIKANLLSLWREHFVLQESMLELDCSCVTPEPVLRTSGHVARFSDLMVKDVVTGSCYRADHLLEQHLDKLLSTKGISREQVEELQTIRAQADSFDQHEMKKLLQKYNVKASDTGNDLTDPEPFNLMFKTTIGPTGQYPGYLRPETAQGIFVNFKRLLEYNGNKLPFAAAQVGQAFRNEIAPRSGLLRVREFTLAEIEHFLFAEEKRHPKFPGVADLSLTLFPREEQISTKKTVQMSVGDAVRNSTISNETLGYFIARTYLFLVSVGIKKEKLRFRQHLQDEMAHYACDCWDAEIQTSYGWIECVGIADRSCYDLSAHSAETKQPLQAFIPYPDGSRMVDVVSIQVDKGKLGKSYKTKAQTIIQYLSSLDNEAALKLESELNAKKGNTIITLGQDEFSIGFDCVSFKRSQKKVDGRHVIPGVVEPSFGIGRILYCILEHSFYQRANDQDRGVFAFPPRIAPVKVSVLPVTAHEIFNPFIPRISNLLTDVGISSKIDDTGTSIGKRYSRTDEIGIPFGITIDHQTLQDDTVTLRERDSTNQVRIKIDEMASILLALVRGRITWDSVYEKYPKQTKQVNE